MPSPIGSSKEAARSGLAEPSGAHQKSRSRRFLLDISSRQSNCLSRLRCIAAPLRRLSECVPVTAHLATPCLSGEPKAEENSGRKWCNVTYATSRPSQVFAKVVFQGVAARRTHTPIVSCRRKLAIKRAKAGSTHARITTKLARKQRGLCVGRGMGN